MKRPLRIWPGVVLVILQWLTRFGLPFLSPGSIGIGIFAGIFGGLAVIIWWAFFSRASRFERWAAIVTMIAALGITAQFLHNSIETAMMGLMFLVYSIPVLSLAFVIWAVISRRFSLRLRKVTMIGTIIISCGFWILLRTNGMDGESHQDFAWRWSKTAEDRFLAQSDGITSSAIDSAAIAREAEWPGFRGANRDGVINGIRISTDWVKNPPVELWRRQIGPGCSSFAIHGPLLFTEEQRGEYEMVTCYNLKTGELIWKHSDKARFWDSHAGAGPRSTPTLSKGLVYTLGATGILNVLDERTGDVIWSVNAAQDTEVKIPGWGYASSPLVTDSVVMVAIAGKLVAYDRITGRPRWSVPDNGESYSSPHLLRADGLDQVLFISKKNIAGFDPGSGHELWNSPLNAAMSQIIQPAIINESSILLSEGYTKGMKRISLKKESGGWSVREIWTSDVLRQNFNDFVVHKGHIYGFEGPSLACIDIENGKRIWKGGRYGGQLLLLAGQDLLFVLSEKGELVLVEAVPEHFKEVARFTAISGRTWNHPVLAGNVVVVRNSQEMAAFRLP